MQTTQNKIVPWFSRLLTTLGQEMRRAYFTMLPSPHGVEKENTGPRKWFHEQSWVFSTDTAGCQMQEAQNLRIQIILG